MEETSHTIGKHVDSNAYHVPTCGNALLLYYYLMKSSLPHVPVNCYWCNIFSLWLNNVFIYLVIFGMCSNHTRKRYCFVLYILKKNYILSSQRSALDSCARDTKHVNSDSKWVILGSTSCAIFHISGRAIIHTVGYVTYHTICHTVWTVAYRNVWRGMSSQLLPQQFIDFAPAHWQENRFTEAKRP